MRIAGRLALLVAFLAVLAAAAGVQPALAAASKGGTPIELYANVSESATSEFFEIDASGQRSELPFELPSGRVLVVTDVIVTPNVAEGLYAGNVDTLGGNENRVRFRLDTSTQAMLHLPFATGIVFAASPRTFAFATNPGACVVRLLGTLQKSK